VSVGTGGVASEFESNRVNGWTLEGPASILQANWLLNGVTHNSPAEIDAVFFRTTWQYATFIGSDGSSVGSVALCVPAAEQITFLVSLTSLVLIQSGYRESFWATIDDGKVLDWEVHHTKQQALRERYLLEKGIRVDDVKYLRGVPKHVHSQITEMQRLWREKEMRAVFGPGIDVNSPQNIRQFWKKVDLDRVAAFEEELEKQYKKWWLSPNSSRKRVAELKAITTKDSSVSTFKLGKGDRASKLGLLNKALAGVGLFTIIGAGVETGWRVANHEGPQQGAWLQLEPIFTRTLDQLLQGRPVYKDDGHKLRESLFAYAAALNVESTVVDVINVKFLDYIEKELPQG
jgi:hypothetical protein